MGLDRNRLYGGDIVVGIAPLAFFSALLLPWFLVGEALRFSSSARDSLNLTFAVLPRSVEGHVGVRAMPPTVRLPIAANGSLAGLGLMERVDALGSFVEPVGATRRCT